MTHHRFRIAVVGVLTLLLVLSASILGVNFYRLLHEPMSRDIQMVIRLDKSTSARSFVRVLSTHHLIQSPRLFLALIRLEGFTSQLKAGIYQVKSGETAPQFLHRVVAGDVLMESFRIIEGTTLRQVTNNLKKAPYLTYHVSDWQAVAPVFSEAEGLLLADTYRYSAGSTAKDVLVMAHTNLQKYLDVAWQNRSPDLPYKTPYQLLIVASVLEKEAAHVDEKRLISGVIVNRLRRGMPLQMDPTVIYGLGLAYQGKLTHDNLQIDSPYNTYLYRGLPPTPIAMVGREAIDAAAHPQGSDYLYFVAKGDGTHQFSATYEQQKQAITRYLRREL